MILFVEQRNSLSHSAFHSDKLLGLVCVRCCVCPLNIFLDAISFMALLIVGLCEPSSSELTALCTCFTFNAASSSSLYTDLPEFLRPRLQLCLSWVYRRSLLFSGANWETNTFLLPFLHNFIISEILACHLFFQDKVNN